MQCNTDKLIKEVEVLNDNMPDGVIYDADTILADLCSERGNFEFTGFAQDIFNIYKASTDKEAVKRMFFEFTDTELDDYLQKCVKEMNKVKVMAEKDIVINNGSDIDISKISSCTNGSMSECEEECEMYYSCDTIALANDLLVEYEKAQLSDTGKKTYKKFNHECIGSSEIAALTMVGCGQSEGLKTELLFFGEDGSYRAYIVDDPEVEIGKHYKKVATFHHWMKIYDDSGITFSRFGKEFRIYRAGTYGCIIQILS